MRRLSIITITLAVLAGIVLAGCERLAPDPNQVISSEQTKAPDETPDQFAQRLQDFSAAMTYRATLDYAAAVHYQRTLAFAVAVEASRAYPPGQCGGRLPPCSVMRCESGGNIRAQNAHSSASGKWQFLDSTWRRMPGTAGYARASHAPERVQDDAAAALWNGGRGASHWVCR